jgi:hypothetical protein
MRVVPDLNCSFWVRIVCYLACEPKPQPLYNRLFIEHLQNGLDTRTFGNALIFKWIQCANARPKHLYEG